MHQLLGHAAHAVLARVEEEPNMMMGKSQPRGNENFSALFHRIRAEHRNWVYLSWAILGCGGLPGEVKPCHKVGNGLYWSVPRRGWMAEKKKAAKMQTAANTPTTPPTIAAVSIFLPLAAFLSSSSGSLPLRPSLKVLLSLYFREKYLVYLSGRLGSFQP
ncbi:hypothetical protein PM082_014930 [Marasmius tenuissimus]|nr:hypothetical protein PM082_014930 [Marasmius tenuissimus]